MANNIQKISFKQKIWLETQDGENIFGDGKYKLLKTIEETGSLKLAMENLGLSYRKTWDKLKRIEKTLGFEIVRSTRGGSDGGSSEITEEGKKILAAFEKFHAEHDEFFKKLSEDIQKEFFS